MPKAVSTKADVYDIVDRTTISMGDLFFHKGDIKVGGLLKCYGRKDPNSIWVVERIVSHRWNASGYAQNELVEEVRFFTDTVVLRRRSPKTNQHQKTTRSMPFASLCYSVIWGLWRAGWRSRA